MLSFKDFLLEIKNMYAILKHNDLTKRGGDRVNVFLDKVKSGDKFLTNKGEIIIDKKHLSDLETKMRNPGFSMLLQSKLKGNSVAVHYPKDFYKTPEFGGKGIGFGTAAEDRHLILFRKKLEDQMIKDKTGVLKLKVGGRIVEIVGIESTPGVPKSDFHLVDFKGNPVAWLSHKDGTKASQFQQYGGVTKDWSLLKNIADMNKFLNDVKKIRPIKLERGDSIFRLVKDNKISKIAIWGPDFGKARGINNVDEFHQGEMKLKLIANDVYEIVSIHKNINGQVPGKAGSGNYTPIFVARFTSDRGGLGIQNARIGIFARDYVSSKATEI
tara:strand:- start:115 stop:1095 length:981 start_codon:yes stop_codon:yes gene_type:complete